MSLREGIVTTVRVVLGAGLTVSVGLKLHMMLVQGAPMSVESLALASLWAASAAELVLVWLLCARKEIGLAGSVLFFAVGVMYANLVRADHCGCLGGVVLGWRNMLALSGVGGLMAVVALSQCLDRCTAFWRSTTR